jgi:predicted RNase H-like nuclease (RuvC/YqgF family)
MEKNVVYKERMKIRIKMIEKINGDEKKIEELRKKAEKLRKELSETEAEKKRLENEVAYAKENYVKLGIPVPEKEGYEVLNGILGMKRDINIKLTKKMDETEMRQV